MFHLNGNRFNVTEIFGADLRSLAALRIGIALIIIYDLIDRAREIIPFYSNVGVLPRSAIINDGYYYYDLSLHFISGVWYIQALLFFISGIVALSLLLGYRTKMSAIISWILLLSLQNRNPLVNFGADDLLRMVLFWGIFLPWEILYPICQLI